MDQEPTEATTRSAHGFPFENLEYEDDVDHKLLCPICREPMVNPTITRPCQHIFCSTCLRKTFLHQNQQRITNHCPSCRTEFVLIDPEDDPATMYAESLSGHIANDLPNRLDALRVRCPMPGCEAVRERFLLPDHVENHCPYSVFPCYDQTCDQQVERRHMRLHCTHELVECRHCHEWLERYKYSEHEEECPELESLCSNCGEPFRRNELKEHREQCEPPKFPCQGHSFGCEMVFQDSQALADHQANCTISRLSETITRQEQLLQSHRDALMTLTHRNEDLEHRVKKLESDLAAKNGDSEDQRLEDIERKLEVHQQQVSDRVGKAELLSFNSAQQQGQFNQYIEACLARIQTDVGAMHHNLVRGRMLPGPYQVPMQKAMEGNMRPGSEGSESVSRPMPSNDDMMPPLTRAMSAVEQSSGATPATPMTGVFASLAALIPNSSTTTQIPPAQPNISGMPRSQPMARRRSSEERPVKL